MTRKPKDQASSGDNRSVAAPHGHASVDHATHRHKMIVGTVYGMLVFAVIVISGCRPSAPASSSIPSPDGKYIVDTSVNNSRKEMKSYLCVVLDIRDSTGRTIQTIQTGASDRMRWRIKWDAVSRVWIESSDIGLRYWEKNQSGSWIEFSYDSDATKGDGPHPPF